MVRSSIMMLILVILIPTFRVSSQDIAGIDGVQITLGVDPSVETSGLEDIRAAAQIIAQRLAGLDVESALVQIVNGEAIQVQIAGVEDTEQVIKTLTQTAFLELVDLSGLCDKAEQLTGTVIITTASATNPDLPPRDTGRQNPLTSEPFETVLTGEDFVDVEAVPDTNFPDNWLIEFQLSPEAADVMRLYSGSHIGEVLAIVLDGQVISAPVIQAELAEYGVITSNYTHEEAETLAALLRAGALPLPLVVESVETVETVDTPGTKQ